MSKRIPALALAALSAALVVAVPAPVSAAPPELTAANVAAFFDERLPPLLDGGPMPGAAVSVVSGGEQVFTGGYGVADVGTGEPVDPERTAFFIASVTKLFTGTAVMQQVERGVLDLDTDVNDYLTTFQIPDTYPGEPITLRHLLTHTAGFDGLVLGIGASDPADVIPLGEYVEKFLPDRVRPPGEVSSYDNFAVSLAGYVVEAVTGTPFADQVRDHLFTPLGMTATSLAQPAPAEITDALARGYTPVDGKQAEIGGQYGFDAPAGAGTISTAADMGRFMIAHLDGGGGVLAPATAAMMHQRQFGNHPAMPGLGLNFMEQNLGGNRVVEHGGDSPGFHSGLWLFPERDTGVFVTYNGDGDGTTDLRGELITAFTEHFFPTPAEAPAPFPGDSEGLAGTYQIARMSRTDATRVLTVITTVTVATKDDGTLDIAGETYSPVGEDLYRAADGVLAGFRRDAEGQAAYLFFSDQQAETYERLAWYADPGLHLVVLAALALALLSTVWWLFSALRRRREAPAPLGARLARITVAVFFAAVLGAVVTAIQAAGDEAATIVAVLEGGSALLNRIPALLTAAALAGAAAVVFAVLAWRRGWWTRPLRVHYGLVVLCALAFLAVAGYYQLLGWPVTARL
ncbi:serine hydrolase domain-containing protein [Phytomonospora endophytica]|uniref:CubicO group peptidase (Beta-lactamase class C family) n=1 Tax=Phytomonospora endophytica TaxID=714109 RepID=A0A841FKD7_9ACTN|nr:serine hydrolase domain-containing protein [Phytomonospora endophytica]MBB6034022.1 CubicO group peptidase (beta-lactamase class C family) [Phytomonospora endophytica]GIG64458.1 FmtA-like protein [Phytomonospora endophytica]